LAVAQSVGETWLIIQRLIIQRHTFADNLYSHNSPNTSLTVPAAVMRLRRCLATSVVPPEYTSPPVSLGELKANANAALFTHWQQLVEELGYIVFDHCYETQI